jgi:hypothetical protein
MPTTTKNGIPYPESPRSNELARGVPAPAGEQVAATQERKVGRRGIPKGAKVIPILGGKAHKGSTRLTHRVAAGLPVSARLQANAKYMRRATCTQLGREVGGGSCGIVASALVKLASEDLALRTAVLESVDIGLADKVALSTKLGVSIRGHLLGARDVAARDAESRPKPESGFAILEGLDDDVVRMRAERAAKAANASSPVQAPNGHSPTETAPERPVP